MSTWNLGMNDVSEETQLFKDKLSSKDGHIAAQQTQLMRQTAEINELKASLNDAFHKLSHESQRALQLESQLLQTTEDLRNERNNSHNIQVAFVNANDKIKTKDIEARELQATLESVAHTSDRRAEHMRKLEREKSILEERLRELESSKLQQPEISATSHRLPVFHPSPSRISELEKALAAAQASLSHKEAEYIEAHGKLSQVQTSLIRVNNEKMATERQLKEEISVVQALLSEREEELEFLKERQGDTTREDELMKRIDEDEAKISALEALLAKVDHKKTTTDQLQSTEQKLGEVMEMLKEADARNLELASEKEQALYDLDRATTDILRLEHVLAEKGSILNVQNIQVEDVTTEHQEFVPARSSLDEDTLSYIDRLLGAINRIRGERDNLRRDVQFLETESRFTIEALEERLSVGNHTTTRDPAISVATVSVDADQTSRLRRSHKRLTLTATAFAVMVEHLQRQLNHSTNQLLETSHANDNLQREYEGLKAELSDSDDRVRELDDKLDVTTLCLEAMTSQRNDLMGQLKKKDNDWQTKVEEFSLEQRSIQDQLDELERQHYAVTRQLEDVESERNSLNLQLTNLSRELEEAQKEIINADSRYNNLQSRQLSTMSSNEATRALRNQIEELEMRVVRRTEQIGIHQHDIRRLETNLRLQEERLTEMTTDLDMLAAQKDAMVEDCADARESRDQALIRIESLEDEVAKLEGVNESYESSTIGLIKVIIQTVHQAREAIRQAHMKTDSTNTALQRLSFEHCATLDLLQEKEHLSNPISQSPEYSGSDLRQTVLALAVAYVDLKKTAHTLRTLHKGIFVSGVRTQSLQEHLHLEIMQDEIDFQSSTSSTVAWEADTRTLGLRRELIDMGESIKNLKTQHETTIGNLIRSNHRLEARLAEQGELIEAGHILERDHENLQVRHAEEVKELTLRLSESLKAYAELEDRFGSAAKEYAQTIGELEEQLGDAGSQSSDNMALRANLERIEAQHSEELASIRRELDDVLKNSDETQNACSNLRIENEALSSELTQAKDEIQAKSSTIQELLALQTKLQQSLSDLRAQNREQVTKLYGSAQEVTRLVQNLRDEVDSRKQDKNQFIRDLQSLEKREQQAQTALSTLREEHTSLQSKLEQTLVELKVIESEKLDFQQEITNLEAELQRSLSFGRFMESQTKESEQKLLSLTDELARVNQNITQLERSTKAAEVNLSLQSAQHRREMNDLQRELDNIRPKSNLEEALIVLEERNRDMEALLRAKCTEIEENDDRALELMKENKKLSTKAESLTRKVQNLQNKLASAKAPASKHSPGASDNLDRPIQTVTSLEYPAIPTTFTSDRLRTKSGPIHVDVHKRASHISDATAPTPVFKPQTPTRRAISSPDIMPSTSVIGKKRPAPDDFESYESLPPQAFTADSVPREDAENKTPRVRRVLSSIQSGFTPSRQHNRPIFSMPSPKRSPARPTTFITDVTNSPPRNVSYTDAERNRPTNSSKKSWLGKIRGSSHATTRSATSRNIFARPEAQ